MPKQPKIRSVKFNVLMNTVLTTSSFLFPLLTVPYVSRVLGPPATGIVSWAFTFVGYFSLVGMLGFNMYGVRECASVRDDPEELSKTLQELMVILSVSSAIVYVAYIITIFFIPKTRENVPLMMIASLVVWFTAFGVEWFYRAIEQYGYITVRSIIVKVIGLVLTFALIHSPSDYLIYAGITVFGSCGSNICNILRLHRYVKFSRKYKMNIRRHFKPMLTFTISSVAVGMYPQIDMLLLGFWSSNYALGLYQLVYKIRSMGSSAVSSVTSVMLPRLSYYENQKGHEHTVNLVAKNMNFLFMLGLSIMTALMVCAHPIIMFFGGQQYMGGTTALILCAPFILFGAFGSMQSQYMIAANLEKNFTISNILALVIALILESILIPPFGINGAALGMCLTEFIVLIIRSFMLKDFMIEVWKKSDFGKIVLCWLPALVVCLFILRVLSSTNPLLQAIVIGVAYCVVFFPLLVVTKESFIHGQIQGFKQKRKKA